MTILQEKTMFDQTIPLAFQGNPLFPVVISNQRGCPKQVIVLETEQQKQSITTLVHQLKTATTERLYVFDQTGLVDFAIGDHQQVKRNVPPRFAPGLVSLHNHPAQNGVSIGPSRQDFQESLFYFEMGFWVVTPQGYFIVQRKTPVTTAEPYLLLPALNRYWQTVETTLKEKVQQQPDFYPHTANFELDYWVLKPDLLQRVARLYNQILLQTACHSDFYQLTYHQF